MAMQPRGLLWSRGHRDSDVSERQPEWQLHSENKRQGREERARRKQSVSEAHCSGKGGSQQIKVESNVVKVIDENSSIRKGKWGNYVFYKTKKMKKPRFIKMGGAKIDEIDSEWVNSRL